MENLITYESLRKFAYSSDKICKKPIRGIALSFLGMNGVGMYNEDTSEALYFKDHGIVFVVPYANPWAWMNKQTLDYTNMILDVIFKEYSLAEDTPIVSMGGSMGGQSAIVYSYYAPRTPIACIPNCPVCDMVFHYTERRDLAKAFYSAFWYEPGPMEETLKNYSPLHLSEKLPDIDYHVFHCTDDKSVNIDYHSKRFVEKMKSFGKRITFDIVPDRGHCDLTDDMKAKYLNYAVDAIDKYWINK